MKMKTTYLLITVSLFGVVFSSIGQTDNTFLGDNTGTNNTGDFNSGFGKNSLSQNTGNSNIACGIGVLSVSTGGFNCAFGNGSLASNGAGTLNVAFGTRSLVNNDSGSKNVAIGHRALESNVEGSNNTSIGYASLLFNVGSNNIAVGSYAPRNLLTGDSNIFLGTETAINLLNGSNNVLIGNRIALQRVPSTILLAGNDTNKTVIIADGTGTQRIFVTKNGNTGIGLGNNVIPANKLDIKGAVVIGKGYTPDGVDAGEIAPTNGLLVEGKVGIGTVLPNNKLEITQGTTGNSGLRFTNLTSNFNPSLTQSTNKFLSVNATGDVVLQKIANVVDSNLLSSNANLMTSNVNGITDTTNIVNSISNVLNTNNQLITTVNGIASNPVNLPIELQTISQSGNTVTLSNGGGSFILPTFSDTDEQSLTLTGNTLSISNGNTVTLPTYSDVPQTISQIGSTITLSNGGGTFTIPTFTDTDGQALSLTGNTLSISNGNSVTLPTYIDVPQTISQAGNTVTLSNGGGSFTIPTFADVPQIISQTGNTVTLSNGGGSFTLPTFTDTDAQSLTLAGNILSISNGNSVTLPNYVDVQQTISQIGNTVTLSNGGGSFTFPTFTAIPQTISQSGNTVTLSNGGGSFTIPNTEVTAGTNVMVTGSGSSASPYVVSAGDTSLYANDGSIDTATTTSGNRVVDMNNSNIWFKSAAADTNGKIYIGTTATYPSATGNYKLFVEGGILTEKVKVALRSTANWADYVFEKNYNLMPLKNVEEYFITHKHLPGIDSAAELSKNGLDLAEMQAKHMAKIEELTLYIIEQNKAIEKNNKDIEELKVQVRKLTANED